MHPTRFPDPEEMRELGITAEALAEKAKRIPAPIRPGTVEVVATACEWGEVVAELVWISTGNSTMNPADPEEADRLLQILTDNTPEGVEDLEDSSEESYGIWLTPDERTAIEHVTGMAIPSPNSSAR